MKARPNFAKGCAWFIALALLLQLLCPILPVISAEATIVTQSTDAIITFDGWAAFDGNNMVQDGDPVAVELITESGSDKAIKMTVGTPATGSANVGLLPNTLDWSGGVGLQMYVKNVSDTAVMAVSPRFFCNNTAGGTDFWLMANGNPYYLVSDQTVTAAASVYGFVMLPAGFEGYVRMPFTSFSGAWGGSQPANLNLVSGGRIYASFDTSGYSGMSVVIDDVSVIKANQKANMEDFHTWFANAATADTNIGVELVNNAAHGMALKLSINSAGGENYAQFHPTVKNWNGYGAMQMYVKNLSDKEITFQPRFFASNGTTMELWRLSDTAAVRFVQNGKVTEGVNTYGYVTLPANYEGYVQVPFSGFVGCWYQSTNDLLDLSVNTTGTYIFFDASETAGHVGKSMLVDEFNLLSALSDVTPEQTDPTDPTDPEPTDPDPTEPETKPLNEFEMVETFNTWTDVSKVVYSGDPLNAALVNEAEGDNALKITVTGTTSGATNAGVTGFSPANTDWSGKAGLQLYMENPADEQMAVSVRFIASNGTDMDMWLAAHGTPIQLISGESVTDSELLYGFVFLPAGFEGYVRIPFSAFSGAWYGSTNDTLDLTNVTSIYFAYDTNPAGSYIGKTMLVDDIVLIDSMNDPIPTDPEPSDPTDPTEPSDPTDPADPETKPLDEFEMVENFNAWTDTSKVVYSGDPLNAELLNEAEGDNALKITVTGTTSSATNAGITGFSPSNADWSGKGGLQIYMENPSNAQMAVSVRFIASNGTDMDMWVAADGTPIQLISGETVTDSVSRYGFVFLPANFAGYVRVPFTSFTGAWHRSTNDKLDLSSVTSIYFAYDTTPGGVYIGKTMLVDDIALIDSMDDPIPVAPSDPVDPTDPEPSKPETKPLDEFKAVETFNNWSDTSAVVYSGDPLKARLITQSTGDKALKITVTGASSGAVNSGTTGFTPGNTNWSGKGGLQIYMENPSDEQMAVSVRFIASNGSDMELWLPDHETPIQLISGETIVDSSILYSFVFLPAGFEGYVRIPFNAFSGAWYGSTNNKLKLSDVTSIYFSFDTNPEGPYIGKSMIVDTISLIDSMDDPIPSDDKEPKMPVSYSASASSSASSGVTYKEVDASAFGTAPLYSFGKVEDFNSWTDLSRVVYSGDPLDMALVSETEKDTAIKITITGATSDALNSATTGFTPAYTDWREKGGLQIYMENLTDEALPVSVRFIASNGTDMDIWLADHNTPVRLIGTDKVLDSSIFYSFVFLPAGFEGYVRIPFESFSGAWFGSENKTLDLASVTSIYFSYDTNPANPYLGLSMLVDDITLIDSLDDPIPVYVEEPEPTEPEPTESEQEATLPIPTEPAPIDPIFVETERKSNPIGWIVLALVVGLSAIVVALLIIKRRIFNRK